MGSYQRRWRARTTLAITCLAALILSYGNARGGVARADDAVLADLSDPAAVAAWTTVNDPVMGGRSTSSVTFGNGGGLVFSGNISLENNGGFASARAPVDSAIGTRASGATSLSVRALGDGKTYVLKVETGQPWSYIQRFTTDAGVRRAYDLPVGNFESVGMFLNPPVPAPPLDPSTINRVGIYILDKQEGPFRLVVTAIDSSR